MAFASRADAYVRTRFASSQPVQWGNQCIGMVVHNANPPAPLTSALVLKATSAAAAAWGRPGFTCTLLNLTTTATSETDGPVGNDGVNRVVFRQDRWCRQPHDPKVPCYDPSMVALTTMTVMPDGTIIDADIEVNAVDFKWADRTVSGSKGQDLQSALVHEFGHLIGLDHTCGGAEGLVDNLGKPVPSCGAATSEQRASIMFPSTVASSATRRILSPDDAKAVCQIYAIRNTVAACRADAAVSDGGGADAGVGGDGNEAGGCSFAGRARGAASGGTGASGAAAAMLMAASSLWLRRRARSSRSVRRRPER